MDFVRRMKGKMGTQGIVLEVGSLNVNGSVREIFSDAKHYVGVDICLGKGVDLLIKGAHVKEHFPKEYFDCVVCTETLEHDAEFWQTLDGIKAVLRPGGWLIITVATIGCPYHAYPRDYWRFTEDALKYVAFCGFDDVVIESGTESVMGAGRKK